MEQSLPEMIAEYWELTGCTECTDREIQDYIRDTYGIEVSFSEISDAWDDAVDLVGIIEEDEESPVVLSNGEEIYNKYEAGSWLNRNCQEYGNTYFWDSDLRRDLNRLIERFGNTYFWQ